jgi:hypothetical protein
MINNAVDILALVFVTLLILTVILFNQRVCFISPHHDSRPQSLTIIPDSSPPAAGTPSARPHPLIEGRLNHMAYAVEFYPLLPFGLNVNRASPPLFTILNGIGPATAGRITAERERSGPFTSLHDFYQRTGISREQLAHYEGWLHARD